MEFKAIININGKQYEAESPEEFDAMLDAIEEDANTAKAYNDTISTAKAEYEKALEEKVEAQAKVKKILEDSNREMEDILNKAEAKVAKAKEAYDKAVDESKKIQVVPKGDPTSGTCSRSPPRTTRR